MADVIIHRCTLRVVRRLGWSWGAAPQQLLKAAVAALPLLIARKLGELLPDGDVAEITKPVRLTIPVKLSELLALGAEAAMSVSASGAVSSGIVDQRLTAAVALAFAKELAASEEEHSAREAAKPEPDLKARQSEETRRHHVLRVLLGWQQLGELDVHLASFREQELETWYEALLATVLELARTAEAIRPEAISQLLQQLKERLQGVVPDRVALLRSALLGLLEVGAQLQQQNTNEAALRETLAQVSVRLGLPRHGQSTSGLQEQVAPEASAAKPQALELFVLPEPAVIPPVQEVKTQRIAQTEFHIRSVLPFLLLGPLAKIGYLDALAATLEAIGLLQQAPAFATALAFKVLSPPARG